MNAITQIPVTISGSYKKFGKEADSNHFCSSFPPILPPTTIADTTVIQNTYMYYTLTTFCSYLNDTITYTLVKDDGSELEDWMIWNEDTLTLQGLVPEPESDY